MQFSQIPTKFPLKFASTQSFQIPTLSQIGIQAGAASLTDGFPPLTFLPVGGGGVPPFGRDFNALLFQITAWNQWQNAGGLVTYDATFSSQVGGYPQGAFIASATTSGGLWLCLKDNNTYNPDSAATPAIAYANGWLGFGTLASLPWFRMTAPNGITLPPTLMTSYPGGKVGNFFGVTNPFQVTMTNYSDFDSFTLSSTVNAISGTFTVGAQDAGTWRLVCNGMPTGSGGGNSPPVTITQFANFINVNSTVIAAAFAGLSILSTVSTCEMIYRLKAGDVVTMGVMNLDGFGDSCSWTSSQLINTMFMGIRLGF